jgi:tRNA threonylcarbamoyladenosine biosynthesis protein TsaB
MLLLAIDTSQDAGSVTLAESTGGSPNIIETVRLESGTFSAQLVLRIAAMLQKHGRAPESIDAIIAATGPGSFTGLRIGLAAVKGLAEVLQTPIAGVSMLEVLAAVAPESKSEIVSIMDARRGEFYVGQYQRAGGALLTVKEQLCTAAEVTAIAGTRVTADRRIAEALNATLVTPPSSADVARVGLAKLLGNETTSIERLDANYLRRDDNLFFKS